MYSAALAATLLVLATACGSGASSNGPAAAATPEPQTLAEALSAARSETGAPGAAAAIVLDGTLVFDGASGESARQPAQALRTTSLFPLVGVTHMVTATLVMQLAEAGRLELDDPLARFVPYVPGADAIRVRDLLAHRSGLPDYTGLAFDEIVNGLGDPSHAWSREEILRAIDADEVGTPGRYSFANTDYVALGEVIAAASGTPPEALFRQRFADPLGLARCAFDRDPALAPDVAQGFAYDATTRQYTSIFPADGGVPTHLWGPTWTDGGLGCTARDTARFTDALMRGLLLRPESLEQMTTFTLEGYGLGIARKSDSSRLLLGHAGARTGYGSVAWFDPERRLTIVALANADAPTFPANTVFVRLDEAYLRGLR